jgi:hypothetical protein
MPFVTNKKRQDFTLFARDIIPFPVNITAFNRYNFKKG